MPRARFITYAADGTGMRDGRCRADQVALQLLEGEAGVFALPEGAQVLNAQDLDGIRAALAGELTEAARGPVLEAETVGAAHEAWLEAQMERSP